MPWMMRLSIVRSNGVFVCGGTLITSKHILTAAHCTHDAREESKTTFHTILTASNILNFTVNVIVKRRVFDSLFKDDPNFEVGSDYKCCLRERLSKI